MGPFGTGVARICAVVAAPTSAEMAAHVRAALRETPTIELRLDWLRSDAQRTRFLRWLRKHLPRRAVFIATCRRREGGGLFSGDVQAELAWLAQAREAGCSWCDLEIETLRRLRGGSLRSYSVPRVLLSAHDFRRTPPLDPLIPVRLRSQVHAIKIAATARTLADSVRLLRFARKTPNSVTVSMGEIGLPARLLALREGSALAYAPVSAATASGQVSLRELKQVYRAHRLNRQTRVYRNINAVYLPFQVKDLQDFLNSAVDFGLRGFSVTLPYKQAILKHLSDCEPLAAEIGAVNTVTVRNQGSLYGCNTDYVGVLRSLEKKLHLSRSRVLILGAGGSARAAAFALARSGAAVCICARRESAARKLARAVGGEVIPRRALRTASFDAILNATPVGMHPHAAISPLTPRELHCRIVMDLIYRPERTQLLKLAAQKDIATVSGVEMFLAQGTAQWEIWMKRRAPEAAMRRAVLTALRNENRSRSSS